MEVAIDNLVQTVETWVPAADGEGLTLSSGAYGPHGDFAAGRRDLYRQKGEGIVGAAWAEGRPISRAAGDDAGDYHGLPGSQVLAIPSMEDGACRGVVTLLCDDADGRQGAFEVWRPNERGELALEDSWYANLERFGLISQHVKFPRRAGLPGKIWNDRFPRVMGGLGSSSSFVRVAGAKADGLSTALGIPIMRTARELDAVLVLLSAARSPLARVMEVWAPDPQKSGAAELQIVSADYGPFVDVAAASRRRRLHPGEGLAGRVFEKRAPCLTTDLLGVEFPIGAKLSENGFEWGVGLPVFVGDRLYAVVTLLN